MTSKPIKPLNLKQCWKMVNRVRTFEHLQIAEEWLLKADISNEEFDELMNTLAYISRELYRGEWG